jgi:hypothetical protein
MKIYKIANPLPLDWIPENSGGYRADGFFHNEEMLEKLQSRFNVVGVLGEGSYGIAFELADGKVLKLTSDKSELEAARALKNDKYGPFVDVYEIGGILGDGTPIPENESGEVTVPADEDEEAFQLETHYCDLSYIVKEKVKPLTYEHRLVFNNYETLGYDAFDELRKDYPHLEKEIDAVEYYIADVANYMMLDTMSLENVGLDQDGNIVCFDARASA